jgi:SAM-dependent methyltransferase
MTNRLEWLGRVGDAWAGEWRRTDRALAPLDAPLVAAAGAGAGDAPTILDLGCGAGSTSLALADAIPGAAITGIDLSQALVAVARERAAGRPGLRFETADASAWTPADGRRFDRIVSRHGIMFFDDPVAAFANVAGLAAPGGRLAFSCFRAREENDWTEALLPVLARHAPPAPASPPDAPGPFAFADPERVRTILAAAGFAAPAIMPFDFDFVAGAGDDPVAEASAFFRQIGPFAALLRTLDDARRAAAIAEVGEIAAAHRAGDRVAFRAAAWIVSCASA